MGAQEDLLREAAGIGDEEKAQSLLNAGVSPNDKHKVNGWTALHWAAKRDNVRVLRLLLQFGGDKTVQNNKDETPLAVAGPRCRALLDPSGAEQDSTAAKPEQTESSFVPNYLKHPQFFYAESKEPPHAPVSAPPPARAQQLPPSASQPAPPQSTASTSEKPTVPMRSCDLSVNVYVEGRGVVATFAAVTSEITILDVVEAAHFAICPLPALYLDPSFKTRVVPKQTCHNTMQVMRSSCPELSMLTIYIPQ